VVGQKGRWWCVSGVGNDGGGVDVVFGGVWGKRDRDGGGERLYGGVRMEGKKENSENRSREA
jgi:hypothetical protein